MNEKNPDPKERRLLSPKVDFVFKLIFGDANNIDILRAFLGAVLEIPKETFDEITIIDPNLRMESMDDKYGILDLKVRIKDGSVIDIEVQVAPFPDMIGRLLFYTGKMITEQLISGSEYSEIKRVISIVIAGYNMVEEEEYHNSYFLTNSRSHKMLTDLLRIDTLELRKLPAQMDGTPLWDWMCFFRAESKEEFEMAAQNNPEIKKAVAIVEKLTGDDQIRAEFEYREKALKERNSQTHGFFRKGKEEGMREGLQEGLSKGHQEERQSIARRLLSMGLSTAEICEATDLSAEEVRALL